MCSFVGGRGKLILKVLTRMQENSLCDMLDQYGSVVELGVPVRLQRL